MIEKSSDTGIYAREGLSGRTPQDGLLARKSSISLREIRSSEQVFSTGKPISDIKYLPLGSQNNNLFYLFNDQMDYTLAMYFAESKNMKGNVDRFLSDPLMALLNEKLSYQNVDK